MNEKPVITKRTEPGKIKVEVETPHREPLKPITKGIVKKPTVGSRIKKVLFSNDGESVKSYIVNDVLLPALKNTIWEAVTGGMKMSMFGTSEPARGMYRDRDRSYYNYSGAARNTYRQDPRRQSYSEPRRQNTQLEFEDVIIGTRSDAEHILSVLCELIDQYEVASVSDFNDLVGISTISTDNKWGWTNLSSAYVAPTQGGYIIKFPRARAI